MWWRLQNAAGVFFQRKCYLLQQLTATQIVPLPIKQKDFVMSQKSESKTDDFLSLVATSPVTGVEAETAQVLIENLTPERKSGLIETLADNQMLWNALRAIRESDLWAALPENKRKMALAVLDAAESVRSLAKVAAKQQAARLMESGGVGSDLQHLLSPHKKAIKDVGVEKSADLAGSVVREATKVTFFKYTALGKSIKRGIKFVDFIVTITWVLTAVMIGLTLWRAFKDADEATNSTSVGIYVATGYTVLVTVALWIGTMFAKVKIDQQVDKTLANVQDTLSTFGVAAQAAQN